MYDKARDFLTIDGLDFGGVLDGDNAFSYSRTGDSVITRVDSSGRIITFKATDQTGRATINISPGPNDGENGMNYSGEKNARSFEIIYERKLEEEGVN